MSTVIFILVDGLGYERLGRALSDHPGMLLGSLGRAGCLSRLTSVLPSTTATALATLNTGLTPQEHGLVGYKLYLQEVDEIANMIRLSPVNRHATYSRKRLDPQAFFDHDTLYHRLHDLGVTSRVIVKSQYVNSPLSRMFYRGAEIVGHPGTHDAFVTLRRMIEQRDGSPTFLFLYWDPVDNVSHFYGPDVAEVDAEIVGFDNALRDHVIDRINAPDVALIVSADHGLVYTPPAQRLAFNDAPEALSLLERPPSGDSRLPYLHVRPEGLAGLDDALQRRFNDVALLHDRERLLDEGWFGIGELHPAVRSRLGDAIVTVQGGWKLSYRWSPDEIESVGCHGGLDSAEMYVPLIAARLG